MVEGGFPTVSDSGEGATVRSKGDGVSKAEPEEAVFDLGRGETVASVPLLKEGTATAADEAIFKGDVPGIGLFEEPGEREPGAEAGAACLWAIGDFVMAAVLTECVRAASDF